MDPDAMVVDSIEASAPPIHHFIIAVDFGTTFSSVAYIGYTHPNKRDRAGLQQVSVVDRYPFAPVRYADYDVPTELWYLPRPPPKRRPFPDVINLEEEANSTQEREQSSDGSSDGVPEHDMPSSVPFDSDRASPELLWGYEIQQKLQDADDAVNPSGRLARFKLILDDSPHTEIVRTSLREACLKLTKDKVISKDTDTIADYLQHLFEYTKRRLQSSANYTSSSTVEFVLCIPAVWKARAARQMQAAMIKAIAKSGLGQLQNGSINNLFLVSEPEAAATCLIADQREHLTIDETFLLLDAGGGTVDAITYTVSNHEPLRLKVEEVMPGGAMCGSSFINERYEQLLVEKLIPESYLEQEGRTIAQIIDSLLVEFEIRGKRNMDQILASDGMTLSVRVPGLKENTKKRFLKGKMVLNDKEMRELFLPSLEGVAQVMVDQLTTAQRKGRDVKKVILMGGFGQSEFLAKFLNDTLKKEFQSKRISLISSSLRSDAVARGAVLRAIRKQDGPDRKMQCSYGFLRSEPYGEHEAHLSQAREPDRTDGHDYVMDTIDWVIDKGKVVGSSQRITKAVEYTFALRRKKFLCRETLCVSDEQHESHYRFDHPKNKGAEKACSIEFDLTFLKEQGLIKAQQSAKGRPPHYKISATLVIIVDGRNLRFEVRWPGEDGLVQGVGQTCIAAAFLLGTE